MVDEHEDRGLDELFEKLDRVGGPRWRRLSVDKAGDELRSIFEETGNPIFAWLAFLNFEQQSIRPPEWVRRYLLGVAARIAVGAAGNDVEENSSPMCAQELAAHAIGFSGRDGVSDPEEFRSRLRESARRLALAPLLLRDGMSMKEAADALRRFGPAPAHLAPMVGDASERTLRRAWDKRKRPRKT